MVGHTADYLQRFAVILAGKEGSYNKHIETIYYSGFWPLDSILLSVGGQPDSESVLIKAFHLYGDALMATWFLNSGNRRLERCAKTWAKEMPIRLRIPSVTLHLQG
ncbi:MAG: hypothetical protein R6T90_09535 [Dissulfuribacterales bacterium]